jgi:hypothetical protein
MLKFLVIAALTLYILSKIGGFFFRAGAASQQSRQRQDDKRHNDKDRKGRVKGGDYIDYEDVK